MDGSVEPGMQVNHGPGLFADRPCANPACNRTIPASAPRNKDYCEGRCKTAAWKARKSSQTVSGVVAVRSLGPGSGDAQNGPVVLEQRPVSKRAAELRVARANGTVASDLRVQYARGVEVLAEYLRLLNIPQPERRAHEVLSQALPKGRRA